MSRKTCGLSWFADAPAPLVDVGREVLRAQLVVGADEPAHAGDDPRLARSSVGADRPLLGLDEAAQELGAAAAHRGPDPVRRRTRRSCSSRRSIRRSSLAEMPSGDSSIRWTETNHFQTRQVRAVEERAGGDAELVAARVAVPLRRGTRARAAGSCSSQRGHSTPPGQRRSAEVVAALLLERVVVGEVREAEAGGDLAAEDGEIG